MSLLGGSRNPVWKEYSQLYTAFVAKWSILNLNQQVRLWILWVSRNSKWAKWISLIGLNGLGVVVLEIFKVLFKQFGVIWSCVFLGIVLIVSLILLIFTEEKLERQDAENDPDPVAWWITAVNIKWSFAPQTMQSSVIRQSPVVAFCTVLCHLWIQINTFYILN